MAIKTLAALIAFALPLAAHAQLWRPTSPLNFAPPPVYQPPVPAYQPPVFQPLQGPFYHPVPPPMHTTCMPVGNMVSCTTN